MTWRQCALRAFPAGLLACPRILPGGAVEAPGSGPAEGRPRVRGAKQSWGRRGGPVPCAAHPVRAGGEAASNPGPDSRPAGRPIRQVVNFRGESIPGAKRTARPGLRARSSWARCGRDCLPAGPPGSVTLTRRSHSGSMPTSLANSWPRLLTYSPARSPNPAPLLANPLAKRPRPERVRACELGALGGTRTPNLLIRSQMLYPLSYERGCADSLRYLVPRLCRAGHPRRAQRFKLGCSAVRQLARLTLTFAHHMSARSRWSGAVPRFSRSQAVCHKRDIPGRTFGVA